MNALNFFLLSIQMYRPFRTLMRWLAFQFCRAIPVPVESHQKGQGLVEYALILVLVAVLVIVILALLGPAIEDVFGQVYCSLAAPDTRAHQSYEYRDGTCKMLGDGH